MKHIEKERKSKVNSLISSLKLNHKILTCFLLSFLLSKFLLSFSQNFFFLSFSQNNWVLTLFPLVELIKQCTEPNEWIDNPLFSFSPLSLSLSRFSAKSLTDYFSCISFTPIIFTLIIPRHSKSDTLFQYSHPFIETPDTPGAWNNRFSSIVVCIAFHLISGNATISRNEKCESNVTKPVRENPHRKHKMSKSCWWEEKMRF